MALLMTHDLSLEPFCLTGGMVVIPVGSQIISVISPNLAYATTLSFIYMIIDYRQAVGTL